MILLYASDGSMKCLGVYYQAQNPYLVCSTNQAVAPFTPEVNRLQEEFLSISNIRSRCKAHCLRLQILIIFFCEHRQQTSLYVTDWLLIYILSRAFIVWMMLSDLSENTENGTSFVFWSEVFHFLYCDNPYLTDL
jgi:hypothetical protein